MEFCPKCKSILSPKKGKVVCSCGYSKKSEVSLNEEFDQKDLIILDEDNEHIGDSTIPLTCWNCGNVGVYFWMHQMARADEAPTRFYQCKKCKKVWRSSK